jgi:site-specific recombinase XerD
MSRTQDKTPDLGALLPSWEISLRAERKSPNTVKVYTESVEAFLRWAEASAGPARLDRASVAGFTAWLLDNGAEAATANVRYRSLRRFGAWLAEEGELDANPLLGARPPKLDKKIVPKLTGDELRLLLKACDGKRLSDRRDEAIVRLAVEAICRAEELLSMTTADVDLRRGLATITRGKGGKGRIVPFGPQTARAIDRYMRLRRAHVNAASPALWLGDRGKGLAYSGLYISLKRRADRAGIAHFHPHRLRHTGASRWLDAGGSEGGLMAVAGWSSRDMIARYTEDTAMERAADESRRLNLGDL